MRVKIGTVRFFHREARERLGAETTAQAVSKAQSMGWIDQIVPAGSYIKETKERERKASGRRKNRGS